MELKQLKYFIAVCTYHSISKSAEALFISKQALSKVITNFEKEIGFQLFIRCANRVEMTAYAEQLLPLVKKAIRSIGEIEKLIAEISTESVPTIKFGYIKGSFNNHSVVSLRVLKEMETTLQDIKLQVSECNPDEMLQMLKDGEIDIAYHIRSLHDEDIASKVLAREPARLILSRKNPVAGLPTITFQDIRELSFINPTESPLSSEDLRNAFHKAGYLPKVKQFFGTFPQTIEWVRLDEGYIFTGSAFCESISQEGLAIRPFPDQDLCFTPCILYNKKRIQPPLRRVIRYLEQCCLKP